MTETVQPDVTAMAVSLLSAYVSNNNVPAADLAALIETTRKALIGETAPIAPAAEEFVPATTVRKSLASRDHILSMIDGKPYKTLKRHISTHGLTVEQYRARYKLPHDYPLVAESYSASRREVAKKLGLGGRKPGSNAKASAATAAAPAPAAVTMPVAAFVADKPAAKTGTGKAKAADTAPKAAAAPVKKAIRAVKVETKAKALGKAKPSVKQTNPDKVKTAAAAVATPAAAVAAPKARKGRAAAPTAIKAKDADAKPAPQPRAQAASAKPAASVSSDAAPAEAKAPKGRATLRARFKDSATEA